MTLRWAIKRATGRASLINIFMLFMAPFKRDHTRQASQRAIFELSSLASFCFLGESPPGITLYFFRLRSHFLCHVGEPASIEFETFS
jgi:hypothetical protein